MGVIKEVKNINYQIASEPKIDMNIFRKRSNAKTASGLILSHAKTFKKNGNLEMTIFLQELYKQIKNIEDSEKIRLDGWKGKSDFIVVNKPDKFIVTTYQKPTQEKEAKEINREVTKEEVNNVLYIISILNSDINTKKIPTSIIAEEYYKIPWKQVFSDRFKHTQLNIILRLLDYLKITLYRGGFTYVLENKKTIN